MKKTIFAFAATLIILTTVSCKKNKDNVTIQGKWFVKTEFAQEFTNGMSTDTSTYVLDGSPYYEFLADNTVNIKDEDGNINTDTYTYSESTKKMVITEDSIPYEFDVTTLTGSDLTLHLEETYPDNGDTIKDVLDIYLKR